MGSSSRLDPTTLSRELRIPKPVWCELCGVELNDPTQGASPPFTFAFSFLAVSTQGLRGKASPSFLALPMWSFYAKSFPSFLALLKPRKVPFDCETPHARQVVFSIQFETTARHPCQTPPNRRHGSSARPCHFKSQCPGRGQVPVCRGELNPGLRGQFLGFIIPRLWGPGGFEVHQNVA